MEDSEKTTDSMLLEEAMAVTEKSSEDISAIVGDGTDETSNDLVDETMAMVQDQDGELVEGVMDNEDIEMADGAAEDSENNNLAPEDSMDAPAAILEGEDGSEEVSQGTLSTSEGFLGDDFMTQPDRMIVQSEPPQQLMEEADMPGEGIIDGEEDDGAIVAEADTTADPAEGMQGENEMAEGDEETLLLHQDGEGVALPDGILGVISGQMGDEAGSQLHEDDAEGAAEDGQAEESEEGMVLRLEEDDEGTEAADEGVTLLAAGDNLEGALSELEGKIGTAPDGTVQLLAGQEALQGMQLMEGDDKPEEEAEAARQAVQQEIQAQLQAALLKQEEMKMEQEDGPGSEDQPEQPNAANESDALATLASAALGHQAPTNGVKNEQDEPQIKAESDNPDEPQWMDVGICKGTHCQVRTYYIPRSGQSWDQNWDGITTSTLPDHRALAKLELESGKAYKFRVAAINSCGRGPWSEVAAFKTSLPGFPGAPSAIKIAKTADGAHLSWEPPPIASGVIEDYHVYLAVRTATTDASRQVVSSGANQLAFVRIYQGAANQCSVGNDTLSKAHIDMTTKPAILFRISARNEKGIGPATQVRWLQEVGAPNNAARPTNAPRRPATENKPHGNYKRKKSE